MELVKETRWRREYKMEGEKAFYHESRFRDGSASITLDELQKEWPTWNEWERTDFAQEVTHAKFSHLPEILRFLMKNGGARTWSAIANAVLWELPRDESIPFLLDAYSACEVDHAANVLQALTKSGAPEAHKILRNHLEKIWAHPALFEEGKHINTVASEAIFCLRNLLSLDEAPDEFRVKYEALAHHPTESNRQQVKHFLARYYTEPHERS